MTHEEIVEHQRREREFLATPLGAAYHNMKNSLARAWQVDTQASYNESSSISDKRLRIVWDEADAAETAFRALLNTLVRP